MDEKTVRFHAMDIAIYLQEVFKRNDVESGKLLIDIAEDMVEYMRRVEEKSENLRKEETMTKDEIRLEAVRIASGQKEGDAMLKLAKEIAKFIEGKD